MKKTIQMFLLPILITSLCLASPTAFAKGGKGGGHGGAKGKGIPAGFQKGEKKGWKGESTPPGWTQGEKKGWNGEKTPPGFSKKTSGDDPAPAEGNKP